MLIKHFINNLPLSSEKIINSYITTCLINGIEQVYNACSKDYSKETQEYYKNYIYIGTGTIYKINGVVQKGKSTYHFFY